MVTHDLTAAGVATASSKTGKTMMHSVRERIPEFVVLGTICCSNRAVLTLLAAGRRAFVLAAVALGLVGPCFGGRCGGDLSGSDRFHISW